jgi:hypothetical protein
MLAAAYAIAMALASATRAGGQPALAPPARVPPHLRRRRLLTAAAVAPGSRRVAAAAAASASAFADAWGSGSRRPQPLWDLPNEARLVAARPAELIGAVAALAAAASSDESAADDIADLLPSSTYMLTLRAAAVPQLAAFRAAGLTALLAALAALPLRVESSPLPVGFGTPRWALPRAVADPEAWEDFLSASVDAFADDLLARVDAAAAGGMDNSSSASGVVVGEGVPASALITPFVLALSGAKQWALAHVDTEWVASKDCSARVAAFVAAHWPRLIARLRQLDAAAAAAAVAAGEDGPDPCTAASAARRRRAAVAAFLSRAQLQARLQPPAAQLEAFFAAAPPALGDGCEAPPSEAGAGAAGVGSEPGFQCLSTGYSLEDLEAIVRTLLVVGVSPPEQWLMGLAAVVARGREGMEPQQLRGFVEGLRWAPGEGGAARRPRPPPGGLQARRGTGGSATVPPRAPRPCAACNIRPATAAAPRPPGPGSSGPTTRAAGRSRTRSRCSASGSEHTTAPAGAAAAEL